MFIVNIISPSLPVSVVSHSIYLLFDSVSLTHLFAVSRCHFLSRHQISTLYISLICSDNIHLRTTLANTHTLFPLHAIVNVMAGKSSFRCSVLRKWWCTLMNVKRLHQCLQLQDTGKCVSFRSGRWNLSY